MICKANLEINCPLIYIFVLKINQYIVIIIAVNEIIFKIIPQYMQIFAQFALFDKNNLIFCNCRYNSVMDMKTTTNENFNPTDPLMSFGERLRIARKKKGLTQRQVGELINISDAQLSRYERNKSNIDPNIIRSLVMLYDVSIEYLFGLQKRYQESSGVSFISDEIPRLYLDLQSLPSEKLIIIKDFARFLRLEEQLKKISE